MVTATIEVPHVYSAVAKILRELKVDKNGTLPGNMGGKPYITAVDVSAAVKTLFADNDLVFFPNEEIFKHDTIVHKDRVNVLISITGTYKIVSTVDGSSEVVSGTGDGLAGGTAVASNIASTNALKNALLRTFLITEQSVEDAAKNGTPDAPEATGGTTKKLDRARQTPAKPAPAASNEHPDKKKVRDWIGTDTKRRDQANAASDRLKNSGVKGDAIWTAIAKEVIK